MRPEHRTTEDDGSSFWSGQEAERGPAGAWPLLDADVEDDSARRRRNRWIVVLVGALLGLSAVISVTGLPDDRDGAGTADGVLAPSGAGATDEVTVADADPDERVAGGGEAGSTVRGGTEAPAATAGTAAGEGPPLVGGFAEAFVAVYLGRAGQDTEPVLAPFYAGPVDLSGVTPAGLFVQQATALEVSEVGEDYWAVTVAAEVLSAVDERYEPAGLRYYTVGVVMREGRLAAVAPPSQVPAPADTAVAPELAVTLDATDADDPPAAIDGQLGAAAERFLAALLAGDGRLTVSTGVSPIHPAPYTDVSVRRIGVAEQSSGTVLLRAEVATIDAAGLVGVLDYTLELSETEGQWQVIRIHAAPPLAGA